MPDIQPLPLVGRASLIERMLSRLRLPDAVRDRPRDFIQPCFYGLGGIGKTRLLTAFAESARLLTPYIVSINFDPAAGQVLATPLDLVRFIIDCLESLDYAARPRWQRVLWKQNNPFNACRQVLSDARPRTVIQTISVQDGEAAHITQQVDTGSMIVSQLPEPFSGALCQLTVKAQTGLVKVKTARQCPMIVILLDTVDMAPRPVREWLPQLSRLFAHHNTVNFHAMLVAAGREPRTGFLETALPPLTAPESALFVRSYVSHRLEQMSPSQRRSSQVLLNEGPLLSEIVSQGEGIPLLLQLLTDTAALDPPALTHLTTVLPRAHEARLRFVIEHYLDRLRAFATDQNDSRLWQSYFLLLYGAIPRRLDSVGLLRALLIDLPGAPFGQRTNVEALWQSLSGEPFVGKTADGALIFHDLVRTGCLDYLRRTDPDQWQRLHQRAAAWYETHPNPVAALYHALQADYRDAMQRTKDAITQALTARDWRRAQELIEIASSADLTVEDESWITLYKADLAWGEDNQALALDRLRRLYADNVARLIQAEVCTRLDRWLGFTSALEDKAKQDETIDLHAGSASDLLWWATQRNLPAVQAQALRALGDAALRQARYAEAEKLLRQALGLSEAVADRLGQANALSSLGDAARRQARYAEAETLLRQALGLSEAVADRLGQANALRALGEAARRQARYAEAEKLLRQALGLYEAVADRLGQAQALRALGDAALMQDRYAEAETLLRQALGLYEAVADRLGQAQALSSLGEAALMQARYAEAEKLLRQALELYAEIGLPQEILRWSIFISSQALDQHDRHASRQEETLARQACALAQRLCQWADQVAPRLQESDDSRNLRQRLAALHARLVHTCGGSPSTVF